MGRKSRAKHSGKPPTTSAYTNKKEVDRLIQKILNVCVRPTTRKDEWENYLEIQFLVERLRQYQNNKNSEMPPRLEKIAAFEQWLKNNDVSLQGMKIEDYGNELGLGVTAKEDIRRETELLSIPYKIMLSAAGAEDSYLGDLIKSRKMLSEMPNVSLALYLHCEKFKENSFYKPYIDILPKEYNTTLYFSPQEMEYLKGSSALSMALTQYKSIARQYAIFFNLMHGDTTDTDVAKIPVAARNEFTYDAYRWAVSSVSTRQNRIALMTNEQKEALVRASKPGQEGDIKDSTLALIPMWDMFNHSLGQLSTDCDPKEKKCKSFAMKDFTNGEQVTICYGARSNVDFLVYNGFVFDNNPFDRVEVHFGVSPNDKLYKKRVELLEKLHLKPSGSFHIYAMADNMPTSPDLLAFLRVFHMSEEDLDIWNGKFVSNPKELQKIYMPYTLGDTAEANMWKFLGNRVALLLRGYKRTDQDDEELLQHKDTTERMKLAILLQKESKRVLTACYEFCQWFPEDLKKHSKNNGTDSIKVGHGPTNTSEIESQMVDHETEGGEKDVVGANVSYIEKFVINEALDKTDQSESQENTNSE